MTITLRSADPGDIDAMLQLERTCEQAAHWNVCDYAALFASDAPSRIALVASDHSMTSKLHGFIVARAMGNQGEASEWEIENLVVAADLRRQGYGTALLGGLLIQARASGATSVLLEVRESNLPAARLYEKSGFKREGRRSSYYRNPDEDALLLRATVAVM